jgi:hypothetical protein
VNKDEPLGTLNKDDLIVLFEWAHRFCETEKLAFSNLSEAIVLDKLAGDLERVMVEPFLPEYTAILNASRKKIVADYEKQMGTDTWLHKQPLAQE